MQPQTPRPLPHYAAKFPVFERSVALICVPGNTVVGLFRVVPH